ncbi:MAG: hypothetical protein MZV49_06060 [Rhodopseudomonas palustris]|nr:hypothetical protein [Rhodopseudomonas palustris]
MGRKARQLMRGGEGVGDVHLHSSGWNRDSRSPHDPPSQDPGCSPALYVAQGLPYGFFTQALPVLLRDAGLSLKAISATSLLFLPWALKFLWAPFVDHRGSAPAVAAAVAVVAPSWARWC